MFDDRTFENILEEVLTAAPERVDVRPGSIYYDAVAGVVFKIAKYYADLVIAFDLIFLTTAVGEYLDRKGAEHGVYRNPATFARYVFLHEGVTPRVGERFFAEGLYFTLASYDSALYLEAEGGGISYNNIQADTPAVPLNNISGLISATFGELYEPGADTESDDDFRQRIREKIGGPAENGNRQHYKTWCEEVAGVGRARIIPLWAGDNTVKGVLIGADGLPAAESVVDRVQDYVDPGGTGLGNGTANIGARFTAVSAIPLGITVSFRVVLSSSSTVEQVIAQATEVITSYLKTLALDTADTESIIIRVSTIGALLFALPSLVDYSELTLNGSGGNIEVPDTGVAILAGVTVDV